jgi:hypothetical protein
MTQAYSNPEREEDVHALPDVEVFYIDHVEAACNRKMINEHVADEQGSPIQEGWYWWSCFPGCLPDGDLSGPFDTEEEALQDAQDI